MNIESSNNGNTLKPSGVVESSSSRGKVKSGQDSDGLAGGGFFALMTALDTDLNLGAGATNPGAGLSAPILLMPQTAPIMIPEMPTSGITVTSDLMDLTDSGWPNDLAMLLAQAGAGGASNLVVPTGLPASDVTVVDYSTPTSRRQVIATKGDPGGAILATAKAKGHEEVPVAAADPLLRESSPTVSQAGDSKTDADGAGAFESLTGVAAEPLAPTGPPVNVLPLFSAANTLTQSLPMDVTAPKTPATDAVAVDLLNPAIHGQVIEVKSSPRGTNPLMGQGKAELSMTTETTLLNLTPADAGQVADAVLQQAEQSLTALPMRGRASGFQSGVGATLAEARSLQQLTRADLGTSEPALAGAMVSNGMSDAFFRPAERTANKFSVLPTGATVEGTWGHQALLAGSRVNASAATVEPSMQSLETMVAETVNYWVKQGVQNAELKLDGLGGEPVAVRISLKGDQAHIDFRTDQPEIRQMLEGALANLKELLKSEGLVLSGVSVGTSAQQEHGTGTRDQRQQPGTRQASLITTDEMPTQSQRRVNPAVGRALDIFV